MNIANVSPTLTYARNGAIVLVYAPALGLGRPQCSEMASLLVNGYSFCCTDTKIVMSIS